jgi:hypothetical protein
MKKTLLPLVIVALIFGCNKETETSVAPQKSLLTAEEQRVAESISKIIPIENVRNEISNFQKVNPDQIKAVAFGKVALEKFLNQKGAVGLAFYFAKDKDGKNTLYFVAVDKDGKEITTVPNARTTDEGSAGSGKPMPPFGG